ncbi:MAG: O-methyltransferase [candidate division Zixibacteria bacterium]|nr:O-methyltransferase [candidate division Zixibacteria bacterium]MDH3937216.1 O-methyltransferase [candidate division Zixibacteria bacterium]MDH4032673.1 O-methyltransferase [candidate division Zixibacteria bacterium]
MLNEIPKSILLQMRRLEEIDARDRTDGTTRMARLRQIPPDTGRFIAILAASAPPGPMIEIGTSAGYSALWLALAARQRDGRLVTFEILADKVALARETFELAQVNDVVELRHGDARELLTDEESIAFCFLDAEKEQYADCYDLIIPKLVPGGILVADNVISHADDLQPLVDNAASDPRVDSVVVPIGKGELLCRKL